MVLMQNPFSVLMEFQRNILSSGYIRAFLGLFLPAYQRKTKMCLAFLLLPPLTRQNMTSCLLCLLIPFNNLLVWQLYKYDLKGRLPYIV